MVLASYTGTVRLRSLPLLLVLVAAPASGAPFLADTGKIDLTAVAAGNGFETFDPNFPLIFYTASYMPIGEQELAELFVNDTNEALEGEGTFYFGGRAVFGYVDLRPMNAGLAGRRVEIKVWQKPRGTIAELQLIWGSGSIEDVMTFDPSGGFLMAEVPFQPTGRATDDGWREYTTGPIDFSLGGSIPAQLIRLYDGQLGTGGGFAGVDVAARVALDGLSFEDLGPALVPAVSCSLIDEASVCGASGVCFYGRCTDATAALGPKLENPGLRADYLTRRSFELSNYEGGREPLKRMGHLIASLETLKEDVSTEEYWTTFVRAVGDLADGHSSPPMAVYPQRPHAGVCIHWGEADLSSRGGEAPIVFEAPPNNPVGEALLPGDVLVSIDGAGVAEWTEAARRYFTYGGDPAGRQVANAAEIFDVALRLGSTLRFERCVATSSISGRCGKDQLQEISVDLAAAMAGAWSDQPPGWRLDYQTCDFRFRRPVERRNVREYEFAGYLDRGTTREVLINGVPSRYGRGGENWFQTIDDALAAPPEKLLFDERLGSGGSIEAVDHLGSYFLDADEFYAMELLSQITPEVDAGVRRALRECSRVPDAGGQLRSCGNSFEWRLAEGYPIRGTAARSKLAVLIGLDVSGNDYITRLLEYRSRGPTRIFGPAPTYGAFGVVWRLPSYAAELSGGSFQVHDTLFLAREDDPAAVFSTGTGISPTERVLQKQSDAMRGVDTVLEAARRWLEE